MLLYSFVISIKQTYEYWKEFKGYLFTLYIIAIISDVMMLLPLYLFGRTVDYIIYKNIKYVEKIIIYMVVLFLINSILSSVETYLSAKLNNKIIYYIKEKLFNKIINTKISDYEKLKPGEYISRIEGDASAICKFLINDISDFIICIINIIVSLYFIFRISFKLSIITILIIPINLLFMHFLGKKIDITTRKGKKINDFYFGYLNEVLNSYKEIKCLNILKKVTDRYLLSLNKLMKNTFTIKMITLVYNLINQLLSSISEWLIVLYASWLIIKGELTVGLYVSFNSYLNKFTDSIYKFSDFHISLKTLDVSLERINFIQSFRDETNNGQVNDVLFNSGNIEINNISFKYNPSHNKLLEGLTLNINTNSLCALVGASGCGKSTLLNLICGLYKVNDGSISIDGYNINNILLNSLRNNIAYIQQEPFIFSGTILENLRILNPNVKISSVKEACRMAHIDEYIEKLPQKYLTNVGSGEMNLSGGQKQRLAIARAIISNRKILLLDEITSDLDGESERYIVNTLKILSKSKTIMLIAHRLTTLLQISNIFVIDNGKVVAKGDHHYLIENCDEYKRLYKEHWNNYIYNIMNSR